MNSSTLLLFSFYGNSPDPIKDIFDFLQRNLPAPEDNLLGAAVLIVKLPLGLHHIGLLVPRSYRDWDRVTALKYELLSLPHVIRRCFTTLRRSNHRPRHASRML